MIPDPGLPRLLRLSLHSTSRRDIRPQLAICLAFGQDMYLLSKRCSSTLSMLHCKMQGWFTDNRVTLS
jgi:hypothetical protein